MNKSNRSPFLALTAFLLFALGTVPSMYATSYFVDGTATGANDGTSWSNAWTALKYIAGVGAGDTVFISGGSTGQNRTYPCDLWAQYPGQWLPAGGSAGNPVTYKIGQDPDHNGTAVFDGLNGSYWLVQGMRNVVISGDAGDRTCHFKTVNVGTAGSGSNDLNVRLSYIDFGHISAGIDFNPATGIEIDHCAFFLSDPNADHLSYARFTGSGWDDNLFHDNTVFLPRTSSGVGADGLQWVGTGYSIYNNTITGYLMNYTGNQHQDGWQSTGGDSYVKVYNNRFVNIANYPIFAEPHFGGYTHLRVCNNISILSDPLLQQSDPPQAIAISGTLEFPVVDGVMSNNLSDGYINHPTFTFRNAYGDLPAAFINCVAINNVSVNGGGPILDSGIRSSNNPAISGSVGANMFTRYTANASDNDYHLRSTSTTLVGRGVNPFILGILADASSLISVSLDGTQRSKVAGAWDIGPYTYPSAGLPAPSPVSVTKSR